MFCNINNLKRKNNRLIVCLKSEKSFSARKKSGNGKKRGGTPPLGKAAFFSPSTETDVKILRKKQNRVFKFLARDRVKGVGQTAGFGFQNPAQEIEFLKKQIYSMAQIAKAFIETAQIYIASDNKTDIQELLRENLKALEYAIKLAENKAWSSRDE